MKIKYSPLFLGAKKKYFPSFIVFQKNNNNTAI